MQAEEFYLQEKRKTRHQLEQLKAEQKLVKPGSVEAVAIETGIDFLQLYYNDLKKKTVKSHG